MEYDIIIRYEPQVTSYICVMFTGLVHLDFYTLKIVLHCHEGLSPYSFSNINYIL